MTLYIILGIYILLHIIGTFCYISALYFREELTFKDTLISIFWPICIAGYGLLYFLLELKEHYKIEEGELSVDQQIM